MALHAQNSAIQWITAISICLYRERTDTVLTSVALQVKVLLQGNDPDCFLTAWVRNNWLIAAHTDGRETPVVIRNAVGVIIVISDERSPLQCAATGSAAETVSMETLPHCFQNTVCDPLPTARTNCQRIHITLLTLW